VAQDQAAVRALAASAGTLAELSARQSVCRACPRLVSWREQVAAQKRRSFRSEPYWGRPVPGWGDEQPRVLIAGLAPAAHGGNRTGRIFTGDRSGDVLFASLWRCGLAAQATSVTAGDGQRLIGTRMAAAVRCAPPANKPSVAERDTCAPWLTAELNLLTEHLRVIVCLGHFAWQAIWAQLAAQGAPVPRPRPAFGHGAEAQLDWTPPGPVLDTQGPVPPVQGPVPPVQAPVPPPVQGPFPPAQAPDRPGPLLVLGCYHPSQQNTFTGRVTDAMLDTIFQRARDRAGL
jgi:uracil-DNA glycosylase family 4